MSKQRDLLSTDSSATRTSKPSGPSRRSLERTVAALREFGRDGATIHELRDALGLGRGHRGPAPWVDTLVGDGRAQAIPSTPRRYRLRPATDRELQDVLREDARRAIARAERLRGILAERQRR